MAKVRKPVQEPEEEQGTDLIALSELIEELIKDVPAEEWKKLPPDLSEFHDEYASGQRKYPS